MSLSRVLAGGDINYSAFIQAIDEEYTAQVLETEHKMEGTSLRTQDGIGGTVWGQKGGCGHSGVEEEKKRKVEGVVYRSGSLILVC